MRLLRQAWLLAGLLPSVAWAEETDLSQLKANMGIWNIDSSCSNYFDGTTEDNTGKTGGRDETSYVQEHFNYALQMAKAAVLALDIARGRRPERDDDEDGYFDWVRISDSILVTFGFVPKADVLEEKTDHLWKGVYAVFDIIVETLPANENHPKYGYNPKILGAKDPKPMIICGENWEWLNPGDKWPGTDTKLENMPNLAKLFAQGIVGVWWKPDRVIGKKNKEERPIICEKGDLAGTNFHMDFIELCDMVFTDTVKARWWKPADVTDGVPLATLMESLAATVLHELAHWFLGPIKNYDGTYEWGSAVIDDIQAVDADGKLVYAIEGKIEVYEKELTEAKQAELKATTVNAYGPRYVFNLARFHAGNIYTGHKRAIENAESFTTFATMMYYSDWNFADMAIAHPVDHLHGNWDDDDDSSTLVGSDHDD